MDRYETGYTQELDGVLRVQGSKNGALPVLAACVLAREPVTIMDCPEISDVEAMLDILKVLGAQVRREGTALILDARELSGVVLPDRASSSLRSSILFLGSLLARCGQVTLAYPGGCQIGSRPVDFHLNCLREMGAEISEENQRITCCCSRLHGGNICLPYPSVGATENLLLAAFGAAGQVELENCAKEPEICALAEFLELLGARITGAGTSVIRVQGPGVRKADARESALGRPSFHNAGERQRGLEKPLTYRLPGDRIVAGTYLAAVAAVGGKVLLKGISADHLPGVLSLLEKIGCSLWYSEDLIYLERSTGRKLHSFSLDTGPFPEFPTDLQSVFTVLATQCQGTSQIREQVFSHRFGVVGQLERLGAAFEHPDPQTLLIQGEQQLRGAQIHTTDLRQGASLLVAGLLAQGTTRVYDEGYIKRGYENIIRDICLLGGKGSPQEAD